MSKTGMHGVFLVAVWSLCVWMMSCEGPAGPDGDNAILTDSLAPVIEWLSPEPGSVSADTVILSAKVTDDQGVNMMMFYISGFEFGDTLVDVDSIEGIYTYEWLTQTWPEGPYPLMARALDNARNCATTPIILVQLDHP